MDATPSPTAAQEMEKVNITLAPSGFQGIIMDYIHNTTNILANEMNDRGYEANVQKSWEGATLFAAGGPDFSTISSLEAARLSARRGLKLAVAGKLAPDFIGWWVKRGTKFDPQQAGSKQEAMDNIVNGNTPVGVGSWAGGDIPGYTMAIDEGFGYTFKQGEASDFQTITAAYGALPKLVMDGRIAAGGTSPIHGVARFLENGEPQHRELFSTANILEEAGIGVPPINNITTTQEFYDNDTGAVRAYVAGWQKGMDWFFEDPMGRIRSDQKKHLKQIFVENIEQAQYIVDWGINLSLDNEYPIIYEDVTWSDEGIQADKGFLERAQKGGFVPKGWKQRVSYPKVEA